MVPRSLLWARLKSLGIPADFTEAICSYYSDVSISIRYGTEYLAPFASTMGVKQGCPLSPTLFGIFIDYFEEFLLSKPPSFLQAANRTWNSLAVDNNPRVLFFADDIVLMGRSPSELQYILDRLRIFCSNVKMSVNTGKTQVVVFRKGKRYPRDRHDPLDRDLPLGAPPRFKFGAQALDVVDEYRYLGFVFHSHKTPAAHGFPILLNTARRARFAVKARCDGLGIRDFRTRLQLFDSQVRPILLYACELWLPYVISSPLKWSDSPIESVHRLFLKSVCRLPSATPTAPLMWEFGRYPLIAFALKQACASLHKLSQLESSSDPRYGALRTGLQLSKHDSCSPAWGAKFRSLLDTLDHDFSLPHIEAKDFAPSIFNAFVDLFKLDVSTRLSDPTATKHGFYSMLGAPFGPAQYLLDSPSMFARDRLCTARLGMLSLDNEIQRWAGTPRARRTPCPLCATLSPMFPEPESEAHFGLRCPALYSIRSKFRLFLDSLPLPGSISDLLSHTDFIASGNYVATLWRLRRTLVGHSSVA